MSKLLCFTIGCLVFGGVLAPPVHAETDYKCLHQCVEQNSDRQACMSRCTYGTKDEGQTPAPAGKGHKLFAPLVPVEQGEVVTSKPRAKPPENLDHVCLNACLKEGLQYAYCSQKCDRNQHKE